MTLRTSCRVGVVVAVAIAMYFTLCTILVADTTDDVTIKTTGSFKDDPGGTGTYNRDLMMKGNVAADQVVHPDSATVLQGEVGEVAVEKQNLTINNTVAKKVAEAKNVTRGLSQLLVVVEGSAPGGAGGVVGGQPWWVKYNRGGARVVVTVIGRPTGSKVAARGGGTVVTATARVTLVGKAPTADGYTVALVDTDGGGKVGFPNGTSVVLGKTGQTDEFATVDLSGIDDGNTTVQASIAGDTPATDTATVVSLDIAEVGFKNDHMITKWPAGTKIDNPDGSAAVWKKVGSPDDPVCYTKNAAPEMFATFSVSPSATCAGLKVRAKDGTTIIGTASGVNLAGAATVAVASVKGGQPFADANGVKKLQPTIVWEVSFDGGTTWCAGGSSGQHEILVVDAAPLETTIYDLALRKACEYVAGQANTLERLCIGQAADPQAQYDPGALHIVNQHILTLYGAGRGECNDQAVLMRLLARSVGIAAGTRYYWGGDADNTMVYVRTGSHGWSNTFRCDRLAHDWAPLHPYFSFHCVVQVGATSYDPSYGIANVPNVDRMAEAGVNVYQTDALNAAGNPTGPACVPPTLAAACTLRNGEVLPANEKYADTWGGLNIAYPPYALANSQVLNPTVNPAGPAPTYAFVGPNRGCALNATTGALTTGNQSGSVVVEATRGAETADFTVRLITFSNLTLTPASIAADGVAVSQLAVTVEPADQQWTVFVSPALGCAYDPITSKIRAGTTSGDSTVEVSVYRIPETRVTTPLTLLNVVSFAAATSSGNENVTPANARVDLNSAVPAGKTVRVDYSVTGGTATGGGVDYTLANGTLTFNAGDTTKNISIAIVDGAALEGDESIEITLVPRAGDPVVAGATMVHTFTIVDVVKATFAAAASNGNENVTPATVAVNLDHAVPAGKTVRVDYSVTGGTATGGGVDYTLANGTLTFNAGDATKNISIAIVNDAIVEAAETIIIAITPRAGDDVVVGATASHTYTINNDD